MPRDVSTPIILGLSGGTTPTRPAPDSMNQYRIPTAADAFHDSAAVLVRDGEVLAAIEEERLNRLKHTNKLPVNAIHACLHVAGLKLADITHFAYYSREDVLDRMVISYMLQHPQIPPSWTARAYFAQALSSDLSIEVAPASLTFVEHHLAHATSAYAMSTFENALVVTLDGHGDELSGTVWAGCGGRLTRMYDIPEHDSLGFFYLYATRYLGYGNFDEYKVMGLAPYGDPSRLRHLFEAICVLEPEGRFKISEKELMAALNALPPPRRTGEPLTSFHQDVAAAVQETVERATMHLLSYYRSKTGLRNLCLAGGVAHNSTMIGKIARSGLFDGVFVQPAAHDAGCALGAALCVQRDAVPHLHTKPLTHVYWGQNVGDKRAVRAQLELWSEVINFYEAQAVAQEAASLIASGEVVGWVQGRAEFGPRALGNRSILADPRPAGNRDRINELVKQRETYRPFAPAVLEEYASEFFEMPNGIDAGYMTMTVPVKQDARRSLGAVTHVDGTARVQTVSRSTNRRFWALLEAFRAQTGIPVLLNTSFNHSSEPIVDSINDAVTCLLTTGLGYLIAGDFVITKREKLSERIWGLVPVIPDHVRITHSREVSAPGVLDDVFRCEQTVTPSRSRAISRDAHSMMRLCDGARSLAQLFDLSDALGDRAAIAKEFEVLWTFRLLRLLPPALAQQTSIISSEMNSAVPQNELAFTAGFSPSC